MSNETNYEEVQNDLELASLNQELEDVCVDIFRLLGEIDKAEHMDALNEDVKKYAISGFKRKLKEAEETKSVLDEKLINLQTRENVSDEEQNKDIQETNEYTTKVPRPKEEVVESGKDELEENDLFSNYVAPKSPNMEYTDVVGTHIDPNSLYGPTSETEDLSQSRVFVSNTSTADNIGGQGYTFSEKPAISSSASAEASNDASERDASIPSESTIRVEYEVEKKEVERNKVVAIVEHTKGLIRELVDTKHGREISALLAIGGAASVVATGPVGLTTLGTVAQGVGAAAAIAGGGLLGAAVVNDFNKSRERNI